MYANIHTIEVWKEKLRTITLIADFHDEYKVTKEIGKGSFARVYYAKRKSTGEEFAIKAFSKLSLDEEKDGVVGLYNEVKIMRALGTKKGNFHMVFYEIHETTNSVYLVIEYLTGGELLKAIEKNKNLSETLIKKIMKNFIKGL